MTGALVFGYMLSSIGSLVAAIDRQAALSEEKMDEVKEYMRWRKLPRDLVIRLRRYYTYYYSRKTAFNEEVILGDLTPVLRFEVVKHSLRESIGKIPLFSQTLEPTFQLEVFPLLKPVSAAPREVIYQKGDSPDGIYFLTKGMVEVISGFDSCVLYRVRPGQFFGETALTGRRRSATHRASISCEMYTISTDDLMELFRRRPLEARLIHTAVMYEHRRKERLRGLSLRLLMKKLEAAKPDDVAAIKVQMAWGKHLDRSLYGSKIEWGVGQEDAEIEHIKVTTRAKTASMTPLSILAEEDQPPPMTTAPTSAPPEHSDKQLDRINSLLAKMEQLIEKVEKTAPRSGDRRR